MNHRLVRKPLQRAREALQGILRSLASEIIIHISKQHGSIQVVSGVKLGDSRAEEVVALYGRIYAVERQASLVGATVSERLAMRQTQSIPLWRELECYIDGLAANVTPKGPLGKAIGYWRKQQPTLKAFLHNGHVPISNAHVERLLRTVALMRKNSLFVGSLDAGPRYAALLTMALNCALCGANPFDYFTWLFDRLAEGVKAKQVLDVMPQAWLRVTVQQCDCGENAAV